MIGLSPSRKDAFEKVTGRAVFTDDIKLPATLYAKILRAGVAHAEILSIDVSEAEKVEGVVKILTGSDCKDLYFGCCIKDMTPLAVDKVRHAGDAVCAVIADSERAGQEAVKKIKVEYKILPHVLNALSAIAPGAPIIHEKNGEYSSTPGFYPEKGSNIYHRYKQRRGNTEKAFSECEAIVETDFEYPLNAHCAMEPHCCIAQWEGNDRVKIWSSTQGPFVVREGIASMFGLNMSNVEVFVNFLGGGFGCKSDLIIEPLTAFIAKFVPGRPLKLKLTRKEVFTSSVLGRGIQGKIKLGALKDGTLHALEAKLYFISGAYADMGCNVVQAGGYVASGPYEIKNISADAVGVYTNTPPIGAFRGYGHPEAHFMIERSVDMIASKLGMSPSEIRRKNFLCAGKVNGLGQVITKDNGNLHACLAQVEKELFAAPLPENNEEFIYGRGIAALMKTPMMSPNASSGAYVKLADDGSVNVVISGTEMGQGLHTVIAQMVAEFLNIPIEKVFVSKIIDTQYSPQEWQTVASISTYRVGNAVLKACADAKAKILKNASLYLQIPETDLSFDGEKVYLISNPSIFIPLKKLAIGAVAPDGRAIGDPIIGVGSHICRGVESPNPETGTGNSAPQWTFGCQGAEIAVSLKTGKIKIINIVTSIDAGKVINPELARIQMIGGMMMGIGSSLTEEILFDDAGQIKNANLNTYKIPTIDDMPEKYSVYFVETPQPDGPFGARCIAEHPAVSVPPAILNAFYNASGADICKIPLTPSLALAALKSKNKDKS